MTAHGQADTTLDPDSPAGVEYELPLEQARKNGSGPSGKSPGSRVGKGPGSRVNPAKRDVSASLFGAGIAASQGRGRAQDGGTRGSGQRDPASERGSSDSDGGDESGDGPNANSGTPTIRQSALGVPDADESSAALRIAGIALAVLLLGGLLGLVLRRGLPQRPE